MGRRCPLWPSLLGPSPGPRAASVWGRCEGLEPLLERWRGTSGADLEPEVLCSGQQRGAWREPCCTMCPVEEPALLAREGRGREC